MVFIPVAACIGTLWLLGLLGDPSAGLSTAALVLLVVFGVSLLIAALGMLRRLALPMGDLIEAAGRVESGDFSVRVQSRGSREFRTLGRAFNQMAERLDLTERQRRNRRFDTRKFVTETLELGHRMIYILATGGVHQHDGVLRACHLWIERQ